MMQKSISVIKMPLYFLQEDVQVQWVGTIIRVELPASLAQILQAFPQAIPHAGPILLIIHILLDDAAIGVDIEEGMILEVVLGDADVLPHLRGQLLVTQVVLVVGPH